MAALCLDASLETLRPPCCRRTLHLQGGGISTAAFTRDLLRLSRLLWCFWHAMSSITAHSLLSRVLRSALPESQFSVLMRAGRFLCNHSWVVLAFWAGKEIKCLKFAPLASHLCPGRNVPDFGRMFLKLKYTDITQNTYIQSWTITEIMAREVWKYGNCYTLIDYQIHIKTGRNMWFM